MEFVPELVDHAVILNAIEICAEGTDCRPCSELAVGIHNWLMSHEVEYLIVDFQDEKVVCSSMLTELLQLRKRLRFPFLFCGLMDSPKKFLQSYAYKDHPFFSIPEEAVAYLNQINPSLLMRDLGGVQYGVPIPCTRSRAYRLDGIDPEGESANEDADSDEQEVEADF